jgi:phosphoserine phosphatase RsbU/P
MTGPSLISFLRHDLVEIAAACFLASLAAMALGLYALRRRSADRTPLAFACFALLYAMRLAASTDALRAEIGGSAEAWNHLDAGLTYAIIVPGTWFGRELLGRGWPSTLYALHAGLVFAVIAIAGMWVTGRPRWVMWLNNLLTLAFLTGVLSVMAAPAGKIAFGGIVVATVFIIAENLRSIGMVTWPRGVEYIGVIAFLSTLAIAVADRFLRTESRLAIVDRELATARRIQQGILPDNIPSFKRFHIAARYVSMHEVAGDFYDFVAPTESQVTILVADVSGHGVPAALIASMVKIAAASHAHTSDDPGRLLTGMSETLQGQLGGQFLTGACLHLDVASDTAEFSGAGHPPMVHWHAAEKQIAVVPSEGMLIGVMPSTYASTRVSLGPGDRMVLYTDGVLEAANPAGEFFGDERFHRVIAEQAEATGAVLAQAILDEMQRWIAPASQFDDDVTIVVVEVAN